LVVVYVTLFNQWHSLDPAVEGARVDDHHGEQDQGAGFEASASQGAAERLPI